MASPDTRTLLKALVTHELLGPDALLAAEAEEDLPPVPEGYELIRPIGRGGAGTVFLARDTSLDRLVAIKFLKDVGGADVERFRREARFTARLAGASFVQVYGLGLVDGQPYIAMQYLDGGNLATADLDHAGVARVIRDVALALGQAHRAGIVHRDIKPENILLDRDGRPRVADFGIARDLRGAIGETMSHEGQIMGTPGLMPPEQARGDLQSVDARSDVYALGATLFFKLTGQYPFSGAHLVDVLHAVIHDEPPLPRSFDASIPGELETVIMKCLRKPRRERYQSVVEVAGALDAFLSGAARAVTETAAEPRASSAWFRRLVDQRDEAPAPRPSGSDLENDPYWSVGLEIVREIAAWDADLYRVSGSLERSFARLDAMREKLDRVLEERPDMAWARFYRGVVLFRRGRLDDAIDDMERAIDRVRNLAGAYFELGRLYLALYLRDHHRARKHLSKAGTESELESVRRRLEQAGLALQEARHVGGELSRWHHDYAEAVGRLAEDDFAGCARICDRVLETDPDCEEVWKLRGDAQRLAGVDPFESYDRAIDVRRSDYEALYAKGEAHHARGQLAAARSALTRAIEIHAEYAPALALLARTHLIEARGGDGDLDAGRGLAERAVAIAPSYDAAVTLAEIHLEQGRTSNAPGDDDGANWFDGAQRALETARRHPGCMNRVNLILASAHLERARQREAGGADPRGDLATVMELADAPPADLPDGDPWREVRETARAGLARLSAG